MMRRWIIRVLFLMLPLFCVVGCWREWSVGYGSGGRVYWVGFEEGRVALAWGEWELEHGLTWNDRPLLLGDMRYFSVRQVLGADGWRGGWHRLGFQYRVGERLSMPGDTTPEPVVWGAAAVPLWWIMAVLIVVVCVVWWKTKAKGGPRAGFPVEVTA